MDARFNEADHCVEPGWATYYRHLRWRERLCGRIGGHRHDRPVPPNDYAPQATTRCSRCRVWLTFYYPGTHRFGSYNDESLWPARQAAVRALTEQEHQ